MVDMLTIDELFEETKQLNGIHEELIRCRDTMELNIKVMQSMQVHGHNAALDELRGPIMEHEARRKMVDTLISRADRLSSLVRLSYVPIA
jgi:hypothetical protein